MAAPVIEVQGLGKVYPQRRGWGRLATRPVVALADVNLQVGAGEVLGLLGGNGAGKTTLINLLCTLLSPSSGSARVCGFDVAAEATQARRCVGLVTSNERSFYWRLTGRQNLHFFAALNHVAPAEAAARIDEFVAALDLGEFVDRRFDGYSTGVRQRFAFARAMLHHPRVLFMDEPTKGLDPNSAATLLEVIRERILPAWLPTIIVTSHNLSEIEKLCHRVAILNRGRLLRVGSISELAHSIRAHEAYRIEADGLCAEVVQALKRLPGRLLVQWQAAQPRRLELGLVGGVQSLSPALAVLVGAQVQIRRCEPVDISLEDVFRQLVGQENAA